MHSRASTSIGGKDYPTAIADADLDDVSISKGLIEDVVIVVDDEADVEIGESIEKREDVEKTRATVATDVMGGQSPSVVDRSFESVESSSLATSSSEQQNDQHRRRFSNLSNLAHSLPSTTLSSRMTCGALSRAMASTTAGGSLDHVSDAGKRLIINSGVSGVKGGSNRNPSVSDRVRVKCSPLEGNCNKNIMDKSVQAVDVLRGSAEMQGGVRRTRSAVETTRTTSAVEGPSADDCNSPGEEITSKSPLLFQRDIDDSTQLGERKRHTTSTANFFSLPGKTCFYMC